MNTETKPRSKPITVLVHSYKGGSGKTLFSVNIANVLHQLDKRVLLIESDFSMAAFQSIFKKDTPDIFLNDFLASNETKFDNYIYPNVESNFGIIYCDEQYRGRDKVHSNDQEWFMQKKRQLAIALENLDYDYVIFDITPGIHLFAISLIALTDEILVMARPDVQNLKGLEILFDKVYARTIQLTQDRFNIHLIINQTPKIDTIEDVLSTWRTKLKQKYPFLKDILHLYYEPKTSYNTAIDQFVLPNEDPTFLKIKDFIETHLL